jgi:hypothetical protein
MPLPTRHSTYRACAACGAWAFCKRVGCAACDAAPGPHDVTLLPVAPPSIFEREPPAPAHAPGEE